jgi:hypothetical protein
VSLACSFPLVISVKVVGTCMHEDRDF